MLITTDAVGGVWSYSLALAAGLSAQGQNCSLATLGPSPDARQRQAAAATGARALIDTGLDLDWLAADRTALDHTASQLAALARRLGATAVHLHAPCLAAHSWPIPVVAVAHSCTASWWDAVRGPASAPPPDFAWRAAATLQGLAAADRVIAPSAAFAADLHRIYAPGRPIDIVLNGLSPAPSASLLRGDVVLTAGRLWDAGKNIATLDAAAGMMRAPVHAAGPFMAPDGAGFTPDHLVTLGTLPPDALRAAMSRAAIFAAPSRYEPFGLAVLEAAQLATPLVLADIATFRELWDGAALFVPPGDAAAWASTLDGLAEDASRRTMLGRAAADRARSYTRDAMVGATAAIHAALPATARQAA